MTFQAWKMVFVNSMTFHDQGAPWQKSTKINVKESKLKEETERKIRSQMYKYRIATLTITIELFDLQCAECGDIGLLQPVLFNRSSTAADRNSKNLAHVWRRSAWAGRTDGRSKSISGERRQAASVAFVRSAKAAAWDERASGRATATVRPIQVADQSVTYAAVPPSSARAGGFLLTSAWVDLELINSAGAWPGWPKPSQSPVRKNIRQNNLFIYNIHIAH